ncbi:hypothetical protein P43SY_001505 [Pythium insidiosum]|uniref:Uncharacterized protein n=1 Tax=Pythium insidiosum TaxID=114742 RepID=A0AAD5Q4G4_PYTIN|nr:hypothetical protein P43SY_001505 [Pythium insidiosum]
MGITPNAKSSQVKMPHGNKHSHAERHRVLQAFDDGGDWIQVALNNGFSQSSAYKLLHTRQLEDKPRGGHRDSLVKVTVPVLAALEQYIEEDCTITLEQMRLAVKAGIKNCGDMNDALGGLREVVKKMGDSPKLFEKYGLSIEQMCSVVTQRSPEDWILALRLEATATDSDVDATVAAMIAATVAAADADVVDGHYNGRGRRDGCGCGYGGVDGRGHGAVGSGVGGVGSVVWRSKSEVEAESAASSVKASVLSAVVIVEAVDACADTTATVDEETEDGGCLGGGGCCGGLGFCSRSDSDGL